MSRNEVRIIGGLWKGRKLTVPGKAAVRPSLGRVRETLFNWLAGEVEDGDCLDLFAGSGALGFEALSRGARSVVLVDKSRDAVEVLRKNARRLGASNCTVRRQPALSFLTSAAADRAADSRAERAAAPCGPTAPGVPAGTPGNRWDIVFLDPPFASGLLGAALSALRSGNALRPRGRVYFEAERRGEVDLAGFRTVKEAIAGDTRFGLLAPP